jgi:hypothetical protein
LISYSTSRCSCHRSFQLLIFLVYQSRFFLHTSQRRILSVEARIASQKDIICSLNWTQWPLTVVVWKWINNVQTFIYTYIDTYTLYDVGLGSQIRIFFLFWQKKLRWFPRNFKYLVILFRLFFFLNQSVEILFILNFKQESFFFPVEKHFGGSSRLKRISTDESRKNKNLERTSTSVKICLFDFL